MGKEEFTALTSGEKMNLTPFPACPLLRFLIISSRGS